MPEMYETVAWALACQGGQFERIGIQRGVAGPEDVTFDVKYCGVCHSDVTIASNWTGSTHYPIVPGHELSGIVTAVGSRVKGFKIGDRVGVGCIVDSCMNCKGCEAGLEQLCTAGMSMTYDSDIKHGHIATDSGYTYGGYSGSQTVNQRYIIRIPDSYPLQAAGPVFCAAITMYSPLAQWRATKGGLSVGVIGIGGLGQMGVRLAKAMGNKVTAISTSPNKKAAAMEIGADNFVVSTDTDSMQSAEGSLDLILNTVSASHEMMTYVPLLAIDGALVQLGLVTADHAVQQMPVMMKRARLTGSMIGGMPETQECMDFCAKHRILPNIQLIKASELDGVYKTLHSKNDQIIRYVLDIEASKAEL